MSTAFQPSAWKPVARTLSSLDKIPFDFEPWIQVKADGEMTVLVYNRNRETYTVNLNMRRRDTDFPHIATARDLLDRTSIQSCIILGETYARDNGDFLSAPTLNHRLKSRVDLDKVYFGAWDFLEREHELQFQSWHQRITQIPFTPLQYSGETPQAHVLPYARAENLQIVESFYQTWVTERHAEGLYIRDKRNSLYKYKPYFSVDAAVIGINKTPLNAKNQVSSLKVAVMTPQGFFIDLGDVASGIDPALRQSLWSMRQFVKQDMGHWEQLDPIAVVEVQMTQLFNAKRSVYVRNPDGTFLLAGKMDFHSMRHPRLIQFRTDKTVRYEDVRETQLPELLEDNSGPEANSTSRSVTLHCENARILVAHSSNH